MKYETGVVAKEKLAEQNARVEKTNEIINKQGDLAKQAQEKSNDLQKRYDGVVSAWRDSVRQPSNGAANNGTATALQSGGLRLLGADGEVLIGFARACQQSENERNDLIARYEALR